MTEYDREPYMLLFMAAIELAVNDAKDYLQKINYLDDDLPDPLLIENIDARTAIQWMTSNSLEAGSYRWMCDMVQINYKQPIIAALKGKDNEQFIVE